MLGFRGCRLAIAYPEIAEMQARAIFEAAVEAEKRTGKAVGLEVMVPLIATKAEFDLIKARIDVTAQAVMKETGKKIAYQVGTMIELPRACLMAGDIAQTAEFFSFGTNDLTQTTTAISRDDAASFLGTYVAKGILEIDPFISVDRAGVGELVKIGVARGRKTRPNLKVGICGEHGGDPASVAFCHEIGLKLRLVFALPRADRPPRRGAGRARQDGGEPGVVPRDTDNHEYGVMPGLVPGIDVLARSSLRAKRSNPSCYAKEEWIASSLSLLAMTWRDSRFQRAPE